jgi:hypothetical protein
MVTTITQININSGPYALATHTAYILNEDISMNAPFTIEDSSGIVFDGNGHTITINNCPAFPGLFSKALTVKNLGILEGNSVLSQGAGWFFAAGTEDSPMGGSATNCYSIGAIGANGGGIFGRYSSGIATKCHTIELSNTVGLSYGGIFGPNANGAIAKDCYHNGYVNVGSSGIFGNNSIGTAINCYSNRLINPDNYTNYNVSLSVPGSGIFGSYSSGTIEHCYSVGMQLHGITPLIIDVSNSRYDVEWSDENANLYLTGTNKEDFSNGRKWYSGSPNTPYVFKTVTDEFDYALSDLTSDASIIYYKGTSSDLTIPENVTKDGKQYKITTIGYGAFLGNITLLNISMPYIKTINDYAFKSCINLITVDMKAVTNIRPFALSSGIYTSTINNVYTGENSTNTVLLSALNKIYIGTDNVPTIDQTAFVNTDNTLTIYRKNSATGWPSIINTKSVVSDLTFTTTTPVVGLSGENYTYSINVNSFYPVTYQWYANGTVISGTNNMAISRSNQNASDAISVKVTNSVGDFITSKSVIAFILSIDSIPIGSIAHTTINNISALANATAPVSGTTSFIPEVEGYTSITLSAIPATVAKISIKTTIPVGKTITFSVDAYDITNASVHDFSVSPLTLSGNIPGITTTTKYTFTNTDTTKSYDVTTDATGNWTLQVDHLTPYVGTENVYITATSIPGALNKYTKYILDEDISMNAPFSIVDGSGIVFDGSGHTITINMANFPGLFSTAVTVKNLGVLPGTSTLAGSAGWFFAAGTYDVKMGGSATNCYSTGDIGTNNSCGGIFGQWSSGLATNCYSIGNIGGNRLTVCGGGGIFGEYSLGDASNCYSTGAIGLLSGGIFGRNTLPSGKSTNCYSTGDINGGNDIFGASSSINATSSGHSTGWIDASANQYLTGDPADTTITRIWMRNTNFPTIDTRPYIFYVDALAPVISSITPSGELWDTSATLTVAATGTNLQYTLLQGENTIAGPQKSNVFTVTRPQSDSIYTVNVSNGAHDASSNITITEQPIIYTNTNNTYTLQKDISISAPFSTILADSTFDGSDHTITIVNNPAFPGLFSKALTVKNLGILSYDNSNTVSGEGWFFAAGTSGSLMGGTAINCYSTGTLITNLGGIFGSYSSGTATNCYNTRAIIYGGIFGEHSSGTATNCYNTGKLNGKMCGGIFGRYASGGTALNCYNSGITVATASAGGIFGPNSSGTATNCYNTKTTGNGGGGIFGQDCSGTATNCYNTGTIGTNGGGIFGEHSSGTATNCYSTGAIGQKGGGIFGSTCTGTATDCSNNTVLIDNYGGGIFGQDCSGTATNCRNNTTTIDNYGGGIFGYNCSGDASNCVNTGGTIGADGGGIFGLNSSGTATNCHNSVTTIGIDGGGIFGKQSSGTATNCHNSVTTIGSYGGGIFGKQSSGTATKCSNNTASIGQGSGGIFGQDCSGTATDCSNNTTTINKEGGGIFGKQSSGTATNCYSTGAILNGGGGIFGSNSSGTATNCRSIGDINSGSGGIFGATCKGSAFAINCYSIGSIINSAAIGSGGIFGKGQVQNYIQKAINCYSIGSISNHCGGIFGSSIPVISSTKIENCYSSGSIVIGGNPIIGNSPSLGTNSGHTDVWVDACANQFLVGDPADPPYVWMKNLDYTVNSPDKRPYIFYVKSSNQSLIIIPPTASSITYGQDISDSSLTGGSADVIGSFSWNNPASKPNAGNEQHDYIFTPGDSKYITDISNVYVTVNQKSLDIINAHAINKVYDGSDNATLDAGDLSGVVGTDNVTLINLIGTFATKDVSEGIVVTSLCDLSGAQAGNYSLTQRTDLSANITKKLLTITANDKTNVFHTAGSAFAGTEFTHIAMAASEAVSSVTLTCLQNSDISAAVTTPHVSSQGQYNIVPSAPQGFTVANYDITYTPGKLRVNAHVPNAPTGVSASHGGPGASITWTPPADIGGALILSNTIYWSSTSTFTTVDGSVNVIDNANNSASISAGLPTGTLYFKVSLSNAAGEGTQSIAYVELSQSDATAKNTETLQEAGATYDAAAGLTTGQEVILISSIASIVNSNSNTDMTDYSSMYSLLNTVHTLGLEPELTAFCQSAAIAAVADKNPEPVPATSAVKEDMIMHLMDFSSINPGTVTESAVEAVSNPNTVINLSYVNWNVNSKGTQDTPYPHFDVKLGAITAAPAVSNLDLKFYLKIYDVTPGVSGELFMTRSAVNTISYVEATTGILDVSFNQYPIIAGGGIRVTFNNGNKVTIIAPALATMMFSYDINAPTNVVATNSTENARISWTAVNYTNPITDHFIYTYDSTGAFVKRERTGSAQPYGFVRGLTQNVKYTFSVAAISNGSFGKESEQSSGFIACFVRGTKVMTATGYKAVETLTATDRIMTADNRALPFKLYTTTVKCTSSETAPYKIPKGTFAHNSPPQDITLSPHHAIQVRKGVWQIPKYAALSYPAIKQVNVGEEVQYFHIEMPNFFTDNIIAEGSVVESYAAKQVTNVKNVYKFNTTLNGFTRVSQRVLKTPKL